MTFVGTSVALVFDDLGSNLASAKFFCPSVVVRSSLGFDKKVCLKN